jgi:DNA-directed RNA polymerase alpha subunit
MKTITIEYNGLETSIKWSDDVTPIEALGMLRYHEKNVFAGLLNYNQSRKEDEVTLKKDEIYIRNLDISIRTINVLEQNKIFTIRKLSEYTNRELWRLRGLGKKGIDELRDLSDKYNLNLK